MDLTNDILFEIIIQVVLDYEFPYPIHANYTLIASFFKTFDLYCSKEKIQDSSLPLVTFHIKFPLTFIESCD